MKRILTILFLMSLMQANAQDTDRAELKSRERLQILGERDATAAKTDDSLRIRSKAGHKFERIGGLNGVYSIRELGVKPDGTDQTGQLLWGLAKTYAKEIVVDDDTSSVFTFNTNFTLPADLRITFKNGCRFDGSASANFNGCRVSAPDSKIFDTTFAATNVRGDDGYFHVRWYGATSGTSNQYKYFAMSQAATYPGQPVWVSTGSYQFNQKFTVTASFSGEKGAVIKYNPSFSGSSIEIMWQTNASNIKLDGLDYDGSDKAGILLYINDRNRNVRVENSSFHNIEQLAANTIEAIFFGSEVDGLVMQNLYINKLNGKLTGNVCGIRGSGTVSGGDIAPQNVLLDNITVDTITNVGAGSNWDCDGIRIQGFTGTASIHLRHIYMPNISKRGIKAQTDGIYIEYAWGNSFRYRTGSNSYSFISLYGNNTSASHVYTQGGTFEKIVDIGSAGTSWKNITLSDFVFRSNDSALVIGTNDGVRIFGLNNSDITIKNGYMQNVRTGVWLDCSDTATTVENVTIKRFTSYAINTDATSNSSPNDWHLGCKINNNLALNSSNSAYLLYKIKGGTFSGNGTANVSNFLFNYQPDLDSVLNVIPVSNYTTGSSCINYGTTSNRPLQTNSAAMRGMLYFNIDSGFLQIWQGGAWVKTGTAAGGGGITALTGDVTASGSGSVAATIANNAVTNAKVATGIAATKLANGSVSNTEFQYLDGVTSSIQTQLDAKMENPMTTSQDIIVGGSSGTPTRLPKGTNGQVLKIVGGNVAWVTPSSVDTGSYVTSSMYSSPSVTDYGSDTAFYTAAGNFVHIAGRLVFTSGTAGTQNIGIELPPSYNQIQIPGYWAFGTATIINVATSAVVATVDVSTAIGGNGLLIGPFTVASATNYAIRFHAFYRYAPSYD